MQEDNSEVLFETLKYSGENFFDNKDVLDGVQRETKIVCKKAKEEFNKLKETRNDNSESKDQKKSFDELLFDSIQLKEPTQFDDQRRDCTEEELKLIRDACEEKGKSENEVKAIRYALGFKSENGMQLQYKKPCVAVVGQTKAGKSSLINALLRGRVVPQKVSRQTARVTYLTYCDLKFVAYLKNSNLTQIKVDEDIKEDDVDLKFEERRKTEQVNIEVRVGTPNPILQNGFDIVDSPGLNENPALNDLCKKMEKSLLPLLIYVVDGRNGLTESDVADIKGIIDHTPELKILYFVTKLDRSVIDRAMYDDKKKKKQLKEHEDIPGESDIDVANRRMKNVFQKLQKNGFISTTQKIDKCPEFNGSNLPSLHLIRNNPDRVNKEIDIHNVNLFVKFQTNLLMDLKHMIEEPLKESVKTMQTALEEVLENTSSYTSKFTGEKQEKISSLENFEEGEAKLYDEQQNKIQTKLKEEINKMLKKYEEEVLHVVETHHYKQTKELSSLKSHKNNETKYNETLGFFRYEIKEVIETSLKAEIKTFVSDFMQENDENLRKELNLLVSRLGSGDYGRTSFEEMLTNRLFIVYDLYDTCCIVQGENYMLPQRKRKEYNQIAKSFFKNIFNPKSKETSPKKEDLPNPQDKNWKETVAKNILSGFNREEFMSTIFTKMTAQLKESHDEFTKNLKKQKNFLDSDFNIGEKERECLQTFSEELAILYTRIFIVKTNTTLVIDPTIKPEFLNKGGQAVLEKVHAIGEKEPLVKKTYHTIFKSFKESTRLRSLGLEVYYTSRLTDPRFLHLRGVKMEQADGGFKFCSFYPHMELGSLKDYLEGNQLDLKGRLKLAIDIAGGLQHLHELGIIHRDITPKNMLVRRSKDKELEAIIADYGVLNSLGFANRNKVGTALYIPSENYNDAELSEKGYCFASDVYSFGITLWQLLSYKLDDEYDNFEPKYVKDCEFNEEKIKEAIMQGKKPETRDKIPKPVNEMLERCWELKRELRPSFIKPMSEILISCGPNDPMKDKTILSILQDCHNSM